GRLVDCSVFGNARAGVRLEAGADPVLRRCRGYGNGEQAVHACKGAAGAVGKCGPTGDAAGAWRRGAGGQGGREREQGGEWGSEAIQGGARWTFRSCSRASSTARRSRWMRRASCPTATG